MLQEGQTEAGLKCIQAIATALTGETNPSMNRNAGITMPGNAAWLPRCMDQFNYNGLKIDELYPVRNLLLEQRSAWEPCR
jgi:hypothetical protein